jgi:Mor family transcriptional regulator
MEKITETKRRRLERNDRIRAKYGLMVADGYMKSAVVADLAKSYRMTIPTVYSILDLPKKEKEQP